MPLPLPLMPAICIHALPGNVFVIREETTLEKGYAVNTALPPREIEAVVHPAMGRDLERLPEGLRNRETIWVFTGAELRCETTDSQPDLIEYRPGGDADPKLYRVYLCEDWTRQGGHYRALAYREAVSRR